MRLSMRDDTAKEAVIHRAFLDGVDISNQCFALDTDEGWADCYVTEDGKVAIDLDKGGPKEQRLYGLVEAIRRTTEVRDG